MTKLNKGQRVYVCRDDANNFIGIWGTVVRKRITDDGAWVRLDRRHECCPHPVSDTVHATWVLTYPKDCAPCALTGRA